MNRFLQAPQSLYLGRGIGAMPLEEEEVGVDQISNPYDFQQYRWTCEQIDETDDSGLNSSAGFVATAAADNMVQNHSQRVHWNEREENQPPLQILSPIEQVLHDWSMEAHHFPKKPSNQNQLQPQRQQQHQQQSVQLPLNLMMDQQQQLQAKQSATENETFNLKVGYFF
jgi:hypothetical protein